LRGADAAIGGHPLRVALFKDGAQLHAVDEAGVGEDVGGDDEFIARGDASGFFEERDGTLDHGIGLVGKGHEVGLDGA